MPMPLPWPSSVSASSQAGEVARPREERTKSASPNALAQLVAYSHQILVPNDLLVLHRFCEGSDSLGEILNIFNQLPKGGSGDNRLQVNTEHNLLVSTYAQLGMPTMVVTGGVYNRH